MLASSGRRSINLSVCLSVDASPGHALGSCYCSLLYGFGHDEIITITKWSRIQVASGEENDLIIMCSGCVLTFFGRCFAAEICVLDG
jgi:hypothetical protein